MASALPSTGPPATGVPTAKARGKRSFARAVRDCSLPQAHQEYLQVRRAEGLRDSTLRMYAGALDLWERWCASQDVPLTSPITTKHAEEYLLSLQKAKLSERAHTNSRSSRATYPASACTAGRSPEWAVRASTCQA